MKKIVIILGCLSLLINISLAQNASLKYLPYNGKVGTNFSYNAKEEVIRNKTSHDYGPRDKTVNGVTDKYDWHGGIDYNTASPFNGQDRGNIGLAVEGGTVQLDGLAGTTHFIVVSGAHKTAYVHIWDGCESIHDGGTHYYEGCILKPMDSDNSDRWALIFRLDGIYSAIGPVKKFPATVTFTDKGKSHTISVTDQVSEGDPVAPIGTSCDTKFPYHYHVQQIKDINKGLDDGNDKNALEYIQNNESDSIPKYDISLLKQNATVGLQLLDDGSKKSTLCARVEVNKKQRNNGSNESYNITVNHEKVEFFLKNTLSNQQIQVQGADYDRIQLGGKSTNDPIPNYINETITKVNSDIMGAWTKTGIEPHCYNGLNDDYFLYDFVKRIHINDEMGDNNLQLATCPGEARFPDGKYDVIARLTTVTDATFDSPAQTTIVDNFKPYIKSVTITANGKSYTRNVECNTCGIQLGAAVGDPFTSADLANGFKVSVTTSEPMNTLLLTVTAAGVSTTTSVLSSDKQNYVFNIPANGNLQSSGKVALSFYGTDMADNQILNFANASGCKSLPIRTGTNSWTSTTLGSGTETSFSFPICNDELIVPLNASIVPASSCSVADGKIQPSLPAGVTTVGLTFEWFWYFNGTWETIGKGINTLILNTLKSGEYKVVVTNTSGCKGEKKFSVSSPNDIMVKFSELAPCIGSSNGSLTVDVTPKNVNGYDIYWAGPGIIPVTSPVVTGKTSSTINNLAPGKYQVFVSKTGTPLDGCARVFEYDLKISNFTNSDITAIVKNPCQSKINSIIKLDYSKFGVPYTIKWDLPVPVSKQGSHTIWDLGTGIYTVNVTNHCGQKATKSFELKEVGIATIKVETKDCKSDLSVDFPNANQPVKYSWAYGQLSYDAVIKDIKTNTAKVEVTDANGCKSTSSIDEVPWYEFVKKDACAGATGQLSIDVHNPSGASPLTATILVPLGFSDHNLNFFPTDHHLSNTAPLTGLKVGDKIPIELTIGTCKINETIEILEKPTIKKFNSATDTKCYYDEECNGNTCSKCIEKVGINSSFNQSNFTGAFAKCSYNLLCPDLEKGGGATFAAGAKSYSKKFMRVGEYAVLLSAAVQSGIISQSQMDLYLGMTDQESICSFVLVCMADLTPRGNPMSSIFCKGKGPSPTSQSCFTMECGCFFKKSVNFCLKDISPKWAIDFENIELQTCDYKQYSVHEIIMWEKQLVAKYPTTYPLSTLAEFIASVKKDSDLLQKSVCATVSFCSNNFKFLSSNIKTIDCKPNFGPDEDPSARTDSYPPCTFITQKVKSDYDIVACKGKGVKKHNKNMPSFFTSSPVASKEVILDPDHAVGKLDHFGIAVSEDAVMPRGFVKTDEGEIKYYDYTVEEESETFYDTKNIYFSFEDAINNTLTYISKNGENEYMVNFEGDNGLWYHSLSSMSNLTIKKLAKNKDIISVLGTFSGNLDYKSNTIAKSETTSVFLLKLGIEGEITFLKTIDGYKSNTDMVVLEGLDDLGLTTVFDADNTKIDGSVLSTNQKSGIVSILGDKQNIFCTFDANSNIKILKASASKFDNSQIFVLAGIGTINTINTNIKVNDDSYTIINFDDKGDVSWKSTFLKQSIDGDKIGIIKNKDGNTYLALTFENQIEIQGQFFKSEGKKDILFIMLDGKGNIKNTQQFGSEDDENAHEFLYEPEGALFFGGEVNGSEKVLPIGSKNFIKLSDTFEQPYISYILDSDFEGIITKQINNKNSTTTKTSQLSNGIDINIYPNPFNDNLNVFIKCDIICDYEVRLMNTLGSTLWQQKSENTKDNATFEITTAQQLPNGVYFIEVKNSDGKIVVHRVVKN